MIMMNVNRPSESIESSDLIDSSYNNQQYLLPVMIQVNTN